MDLPLLWFCLVGFFIALYLILGVVDFVLMRRYARLDPERSESPGELPEPAVGY